MYSYIFFFFQAEDGIRDATVTGVQTCALPIYLGEPGNSDDPALSVDGRYIAFATTAANMHNGVDDNSGLGPCTFSDFAPPSTFDQNCSDIVVRDLVVDAAR